MWLLGEIFLWNVALKSFWEWSYKFYLWCRSFSFWQCVSWCESRCSFSFVSICDAYLCCTSQLEVLVWGKLKLPPTGLGVNGMKGWISLTAFIYFEPRCLLVAEDGTVPLKIINPSIKIRSTSILLTLSWFKPTSSIVRWYTSFRLSLCHRKQCHSRLGVAYLWLHTVKQWCFYKASIFGTNC